MADNEIELSLEDFEIAADGSVVFTGAPDGARLKIPKERAADSLMKLLIGIARASEKPGPAYRLMVSPVQIGLERVGMPQAFSIPCIDLQLEKDTHLRIALQPEWLKPLAERLLSLSEVILKERRAN